MAIPSMPDNRRYSHCPDTALYMARMGKTFIIKGDNLNTLSSGVVQTAAGSFKAIPEGSSAVIAGFMLHLHSLSDEVNLEIGCTSNADATGDFVATSPTIHMETGDKKTGSVPAFVKLPVPMYLTYSSTCKAVAVKLTTNNNDAVVGYAVAGWLEETG